VWFHFVSPISLLWFHFAILAIGVAEVLVRAAKNEGSTDNITVIVVFLKQTLSPPITSEDNE